MEGDVVIRTDPRDGSIYIGGEYHSSTGLEPWRCPTLYKLDKEGNPIWTAWNWTGPIVGTDRYRLVSDSAVRQLQVAASGDLVVGGWSDGGNSCFLNQPYDLTIRRKASKFGDSTWGAGVLSVAHIMKLDSETMELQGGCTWLTYNPTENKPNSCRINSLNELSDGRVVFTGGSTFGLIESPDAWVEAWWTAYQRDPAQAKVKGGLISPSSALILTNSSSPPSCPGSATKSLPSRGTKSSSPAKPRNGRNAMASMSPPLPSMPSNPNSGAANPMVTSCSSTPENENFPHLSFLRPPYSRREPPCPESLRLHGSLGTRRQATPLRRCPNPEARWQPLSQLLFRRTKIREITILSEADLLGDDFTLHSKGGIQCLFNRMAPKPGMELKVPGGTLGGNLKDGPLDVTIEGFAGWKIIKDAKNPTLVAKTIGFVSIHGKKAKMEGITTFRFDEKSPKWSMSSKCIFKGKDLGLPSNQHGDIQLQLYTNSPVSKQTPNFPSTELKFE